MLHSTEHCPKCFILWIHQIFVLDAFLRAVLTRMRNNTFSLRVIAIRKNWKFYFTAPFETAADLVRSIETLNIPREKNGLSHRVASCFTAQSSRVQTHIKYLKHRNQHYFTWFLISAGAVRCENFLKSKLFIFISCAMEIYTGKYYVCIPYTFRKVRRFWFANIFAVVRRK